MYMRSRGKNVKHNRKKKIRLSAKIEDFFCFLTPFNGDDFNYQKVDFNLVDLVTMSILTKNL